MSKEILKLVRASSALHAISDRTERSRSSFYDAHNRTDPEYDTDAIYFELLRNIGRAVELRVVVDIIAGASAGGINGAMLARALSHDLPMGALRDLWLDHADVSDLIAPEARAQAGSKLVLKPFVWLLGAAGLWNSVRDHEVRRKISLVIRSRWFKPPLSGRRMTELMYNAVIAMGRPKHRRSSLLPSNHKLDLFVTLTDHYGFRQPLQIHDPPIIEEREHRHILRFQYQRKPDGETDSDFDYDNAPALAFAARATSSFPGAFPPAQISEMDQFTAQKSIPWPTREDFITKNFAPYIRLNVDPTTACFLDGSILNNRPFRAAISAIHKRPAHRQVDRRVVYIDPDPASPIVSAHRGVPGFFSALKGALADLPNADPISDELNWVSDFNERTRRVREIIEDAQPRVRDLVMSVVAAPFDRAATQEEVRFWREDVNARAAEDAGFAYEGYVRLKLASVRTFISGLIARLLDVPGQTPSARIIAEIIDAWAAASDLAYAKGRHQSVHLEQFSATDQLPHWLKFLLAFDIDYRKRRLHFMIEGQNRLYQIFDHPQFAGFDRAVVDRFKRELYNWLEDLDRHEKPESYRASTREFIKTVFAPAMASTGADDIEDYTRRFVVLHRENIDRVLDMLASEIDLDSSTNGLDMLVASASPSEWHPHARRDLLVNYLGFPFWDVLTYPMAVWREGGELDKILVDRISPLDSSTLKEFNGRGGLKGTSFAHFGAFFSRAYRENDYLLGRIHALDRLIDIVCDSARLNKDSDRGWILALKVKGFRQILDAEELHLPNSAALIGALRRSVAALDASL
ncbi:MAG TPA: patatin-like protein [Beijerinckiaceae bacterium]|nr:patatin-like protein [Beijerinckiaceae bacterium]